MMWPTLNVVTSLRFSSKTKPVVATSLSGKRSRSAIQLSKCGDESLPSAARFQWLLHADEATREHAACCDAGIAPTKDGVPRQHHVSHTSGKGTRPSIWPYRVILYKRVRDRFGFNENLGTAPPNRSLVPLNTQCPRLINQQCIVRNIVNMTRHIFWRRGGLLQNHILYTKRSPWHRWPGVPSGVLAAALPILEK